MSIRELRHTAVNNIKKGWPEFCFISLLCSGIIAFGYTAILLVGQITGVSLNKHELFELSTPPPSFVIPAVIIILAVYVSSIPLYYGIRWFYMQAARGFIAPLSSLFAMYRSKKTIRACFITKAATLLSMIRNLALPAAAVYLLSVFFLQFAETRSRFRFPVLILLGAMVALLIGYMISISMDYLFVSYLFTSDPYRKPRDIIIESRRLFTDNLTPIAKITATNCFWLVLAPIVFPLIFIIPYVNFIFAVTLSDLIKPHEQKEQTFAENIETTP